MDVRAGLLCLLWKPIPSVTASDRGFREHWEIKRLVPTLWASGRCPVAEPAGEQRCQPWARYEREQDGAARQCPGHFRS